MPNKMAAQSCTFSTEEIGPNEKEPNFSRQNPFVWYWHSIMNQFSGVSDSTKRHTHHNRLHWEVHCEQQSGRFLKLTPLLQVLVTRRYFASEGNFQYVYGELVGMVKNRLVQSPPSNLLRGALRYPTYIDICSNPTPYFTRQCLIVDSERIARSNPASSNKTLTCSLQSLPFASSNVSGFSCLFKKSNRG